MISTVLSRWFQIFGDVHLQQKSLGRYRRLPISHYNKYDLLTFSFPSPLLPTLSLPFSCSLLGFADTSLRPVFQQEAVTDASYLFFS